MSGLFLDDYLDSSPVLNVAVAAHCWQRRPGPRRRALVATSSSVGAGVVTVGGE